MSRRVSQFVSLPKEKPKLDTDEAKTLQPASSHGNEARDHVPRTDGELVRLVSGLGNGVKKVTTETGS
jgi:hypothetical protein